MGSTHRKPIVAERGSRRWRLCRADLADALAQSLMVVACLMPLLVKEGLAAAAGDAAVCGAVAGVAKAIERWVRDTRQQ